MILNSIKSDTNWGEAASAINDNFSKTNLEISKVSASSSKFKGFYTIEALLLTAIPSPIVGDNAWVGASYPGVVYVCNTSGTWTATATVPTPPAVNISEYYKKAETDALIDTVDANIASIETDLNKITDKNIVLQTFIGSVLVTDGLVSTSTDYEYSNYIPVIPGEKYNITTVIGSFAGIAGYNLDKVFVSAVYPTSWVAGSPRILHANVQFEIPSGVYYIRGCSAVLDTTGNNWPTSNLIILAGNSLSKIEKSVDQITGKNISTIEGYGAVSSLNGGINLGSDYQYSYYIPVIPGDTYYVTAVLGGIAGLVGYNNLKNYVIPLLSNEKPTDPRLLYKEIKITIPEGVYYMRGCSAIRNTIDNFSPYSDLIISKNKTPIVSGLQSKIRVMTYNIGHYTDSGVSQNSSITFENYLSERTKWRTFLNSVNVDIVAIQEYSSVFCQSNATKSYDDLYKYSFKYKYEGVQIRYSCNALFSSLLLQNIRKKEYICNQTAVITHTTLIQATDYYYITGELYLNGERITIVTTHLAFDYNNPQVEIDQINELIYTLSSHEKVIIMGDFNIAGGVVEFDAFTNAGYEMANHSYFGDIETYIGNTSYNKVLDNVIVKGVKIKCVKTELPMNLLDHIPLIVDIII